MLPRYLKYHAIHIEQTPILTLICKHLKSMKHTYYLLDYNRSIMASILQRTLRILPRKIL